MFKKQRKKVYSADQIQQLTISDIVITDNRTRNTDFSYIVHLAASIERVGLLNPILVRYNNNKYELVAGECRLRACILLEFKTIRAIVVPNNSVPSEMLSLHENMFSSPLEPVEVAQNLKQLTGQGCSTSVLAESLQVGEDEVDDYLYLYGLPDNIRQLATVHHLEKGFLLHLNTLETPARMEAAIRRYVSKRETLPKQTVQEIAQTEHFSENLTLRQVTIRADKRIYYNTLYESLDHLKNFGVSVEASTVKLPESTVTHIIIKDETKTDSA